MFVNPEKISKYSAKQNKINLLPNLKKFQPKKKNY